MTPAGGEPLDRIGLRPEALADATPAERLKRYFEVPSTLLRQELPDWHLSTHVEPSIENARAPCRTCLMTSARSTCHRPPNSTGKGCSGGHSTTSTERARSSLSTGSNRNSTRAALMDGSPRGRRSTCSKPLRAPTNTATETYRERAADLPVDVTIAERLTREELAAVFAAPNDFVHFVGHCDVDGLRCPDGSFPTASLDECPTRTFFLNPCGSYHEGLGLVEAGNVAGAVTLTAVLNEHAAVVRTVFARLLVYGFDIEQAIQLSRQRIMMGTDYAVVGDGTHTLVRETHEPPAVARLEDRGEQFGLTYAVLTTGTTGTTYRFPGEDDRAYPSGVDAAVELDHEELVAFLERTALPVVYDGDFHWSTDLVDRLE